MDGRSKSQLLNFESGLPFNSGSHLPFDPVSQINKGFVERFHKDD